MHTGDIRFFRPAPSRNFIGEISLFIVCGEVKKILTLTDAARFFKPAITLTTYCATDPDEIVG